MSIFHSKRIQDITPRIRSHFSLFGSRTSKNSNTGIANVKTVRTFNRMPYNTKDELYQLGQIDPEMAQLLQDHPQSEGHESIQERKAFSLKIRKDLRERFASPEPGIKRTTVPYTTSDGVRLDCYLFQPDPLPKEGAPLIVYIHGGGFAVGGPESGERVSRPLVREFGAVCYAMAYRLAPEHTFPTAAQDAWEGLKFAARSAKQWGADPVGKGFILAGDSAGGNLTAGLTHTARDKQLDPPLTGQWLGCPWVSPPLTVPAKYRDRYFSYEQNKDAPALSKTAVDMYCDAYKPDYSDDRFNIISHSKGHAGLPPAYIQICGMDPFRDEGLIYESILRTENSIKTRLDVYRGLPHGFWIFYPTLSHVSKFQRDVIAGIGWLLDQKPSQTA